MADDDEAFVETVEENNYEPVPDHQNHQDAPVEPSFIRAMIMFYISNPWFLLFLAVCLYSLFSKYRSSLEERYENWKFSRQQENDAQEIQNNPELYRAKMEAMDAARRKLQEKYNSDTSDWIEKEKIKEEERRKQKLEEMENLMAGKGYRNKAKVSEAEWQSGAAGSSSSTKSNATKKSTFKSDYNPLMGSSGGSVGYRPSRRGPSAGG